ncbi:DUF547 domain-containing protein [Roseateles oligotrophus]|uniref:DUF547 domain-containing protein n=1 Tax=Roseateles oligotrophus TaxID=1769250 RepID=A0ABT2YH29_9BURK|nr:DUF547 domain-containing protein [Roseateles oligotrophus]MCV2369364.1 DUF547 domain-containing protein [Roseateles oligotrophus]
MKTVIQRRLILASCLLWVLPARAQSFDHQHAAWAALLKKHVVVLDGGRASQLRYAGFASDRAALTSYLAALSAVSKASFDAFSKPQQMAFLLNAYNAFTVELILTRYPKLASIKELGSLIQSPWKQKFIPLLGKQLSLDGIEQDMLRERGRFDDPRLHFAVNCASIGCPPLREEAFVAERLDAQLDEQARRFLSDRSRNRWNGEQQRFEVSKIFDWYADDFKLGHRGIGSVGTYLARHADQLADVPAERERLRGQTVAKISYLDYDWKLNDARP